MINNLMNFTHTKISPKRPLLSYSKIQLLIAFMIRNRKFFIDKKMLKNKEYLDIGCGPNIHQNFINLDYSWLPGIDLCWDITKGIPLSDSSLQGIFSEHCLEHLSIEEADYVLRECKRILRPGGTIRIVVPDGEMYLTGYTALMQGKGDPLPYAKNDGYKGIYSPIMSVNRIFYSHGHCFIYDYLTLKLLLEKHGFVEVKKEQFDTGRDPELLIDSIHRACESLYVEASA